MRSRIATQIGGDERSQFGPGPFLDSVVSRVYHDLSASVTLRSRNKVDLLDLAIRGQIGSYSIWGTRESVTLRLGTRR